MSRITEARLGTVKRILFMPSGKIMWTVVGRDNEYWTDPSLGFCSCKDFYFVTLSGGNECYHLKQVRKAMLDSRFETVEFGDNQYIPYLQAIAQDNINILGRV